MKELCGDISKENPLTSGQKIWYLLYNFFRGIGGYVARQQTMFWPHIEYRELPDSPGRRYLDSFIMHELPMLAPGQNIRVLDVGCGSGYLRDMLTKAGYTGVYTGIDVIQSSQYSTASDTAFKSTFIKTKIEEYKSAETYDLVISNTALEHVVDDHAAIDRCRELTGDSGIQVHIVPAFWSLFAYLWHGYRQYTPKRVQSLFRGQPYRVYRLGGLASLVVHIASITIPERIIGRQTIRNTAWYYKAVYLAQKIDRLLPICSMMYVIVVSKNG